MNQYTRHININAAKKIQKMVEAAEKIFDETFGPVDHNTRRTEAVFRRAAYVLIIKPDDEVLRPSFQTIAYGLQLALKTEKCLAHCTVMHNRKTAMNLIASNDKLFRAYIDTAARAVQPLCLTVQASIEKP